MTPEEDDQMSERLHPEGAPGIAGTFARAVYGDSAYESMQEQAAAHAARVEADHSAHIARVIVGTQLRNAVLVFGSTFAVLALVWCLHLLTLRIFT